MVVSPSAPRTEEGLYWGYSVRLASSFGAVFTQSPYREGYDVTIGTSERGTSVDDLELPNFRYAQRMLPIIPRLNYAFSIDFLKYMYSVCDVNLWHL